MIVRDERQKKNILTALGDEYARRILLSTMREAKSIERISRDYDIPLTTAYRRVHELQEAGLVIVQGSHRGPDGKWTDLYRSVASEIRMQFNPSSLDVEISISEDVADKLARLWGYMRRT